MGSNASTTKKRHWLRWLLLTLAVLLAVFYLGGGWYFSGRIKAGGLDPKPPERNYDVTIEALDAEAVVLAGDDEAIDDPGEYALVWEDGYGLVGDVASITADGVRRPFDQATGTVPPLSPDEVDLDSWYYPTDPADAGLEFKTVQYQSPLGDFDAWYVPAADEPTTTWAIHAHGWRTDRREAIRPLATFREAGIDSLVIELRNDPDAPADPSGLYRFGRTEWQEIEGAVRYALDNGAEQVILAGYSTGATGEMAFLAESVLADNVAAIFFDSPNLDFGRAVKVEARNTALIPGLPLTVPDSLTAVAMTMADLRFDVGWDEINYVDDGAAVAVPTLVVHGDQDGTVPLSVSEDFAATNPTLIELVVFPGADHVRSWNVDRARYETTLGAFLVNLGS
jgi:alpha-beta hydrolase superfamily lysophospholipase